MSITTSIVFDNEQERDYIKRLIKVRRNLIGLVENGALTAVPDMIELAMSAIQGNHKQQNVSPSGIVSGGTVDLPSFVEDVLNGGTYPNQEDCTQEERAVLYDAKFKVLFKAYTQAKDDKVRLNLRETILATVNEILG